MAKVQSTIEEVPISKDPMTKLIPWIIALLVFLLCLILSGVSSLGVSMHKWQVGMSHRITIEIPIQHEIDRDRITTSVADYLKTNSGLIKVEIADKTKLFNLYSVSLKQADQYQNFPLPVIVDVTLNPENPANVNEMVAQLQQYTPGVRFETYTQWHSMMNILQRSMQVIAYTFIMLIILTVIVVITLVTKAGLLAHQESINILRLIGASNSYVANKFQINALKLSTRGAVIGFFLALPMTWLLNLSVVYIDNSDIFHPQFDFFILLMLTSVPLFVVLLCICVSRLAVLKTLSSA